MKWWTSYYMQQALMPQLQRVQRCLAIVLEFWMKLECGSSMHTVDEGVQDGHGTVGDTGIGMDLFED
jgi:hypothetical protein